MSRAEQRAGLNAPLAAQGLVDARADENLAQAIAAIRARLSPAPAADHESAAAEEALREVLRLYDAGDPARAREALTRFRQAYPRDPLSQLVR
jgi:TolA-binding protein